ncbi:MULTISPECIES: dinucleotide-utilizing enzyme [unclassified Microbacterium]|uniref:dinucleotide-utilizing enzyme n=1 Tax=unclassified Microbacterium TaxID=2609290 RepID=UPI00374579DD
MTSRPRLITSIPFWILLIGSVVVGVLGLWTVFDRLGVMERGLEDGTATTAQVYGGQSWAVVGAILLGAGIVGVALALTLAAARSLVARTDAVAVEAIDWTADDGTVEESLAPSASDALFAGQPVTPATTAAPVIAEDPDVEVPSTATAPAAATHDAPLIDTGSGPAASAPEDDTRR